MICLILGILFLILGAVGLLLPVIPQVPFLVAGMLLLMKGSTKFSRWIKDKKLYQQYAEPVLKKNPMLKKLAGENEE